MTKYKEVFAKKVAEQTKKYGWPTKPKNNEKIKKSGK